MILTSVSRNVANAGVIEDAALKFEPLRPISAFAPQGDDHHAPVITGLFNVYLMASNKSLGSRVKQIDSRSDSLCRSIRELHLMYFDTCDGMHDPDRVLEHAESFIRVNKEPGGVVSDEDLGLMETLYHELGTTERVCRVYADVGVQAMTTQAEVRAALWQYVTHVLAPIHGDLLVDPDGSGHYALTDGIDLRDIIPALNSLMGSDDEDYADDDDDDDQGEDDDDADADSVEIGLPAARYSVSTGG